MFDRTRGEGRSKALRGACRPTFDALEGRQLLAATLGPIGNLSVPTGLGYQLPLEGGSGAPQTYSVTSSNPQVKATVAQGKFLTVNVSHASSGAGDPAFTGSMTFQLFDDLTPLTTSRIEQLVQTGFYSGRNFHRIAAGFPGPNDYIVQGGSVSGTGTGDVGLAGFPFSDEFVQQLAFTGQGQLAMANAGDDTNSSQFFVTTGSPRFLDFQHTIFGQLVQGTQTLTLMTQVAKGSDGTTPVSPINIDSATLSDTNPDGVIHIDATSAIAGQTSTLTVTANDPSTGTSTSQTFQVNVTPNTDASGQPIQERPFLGPVPTGLTVAPNQPAIFQLHGIDANPGDQLTYGVGGGPGTGTTPFTPVQNATATVNQQTGVVTVIPNAGFTGTISLLVGVRDQTDRVGTTASPMLDNIGNYDTQKLTLSVVNGQPVNLAPIAVNGTTNVVDGQSATGQLLGLTANPTSTTQTLTYSLVSQPQHGSISNFNAQTGTFTYTPSADFQGSDSFFFQVADNGEPGPSLTSLPAQETIVVAAGNTGAVRLINNVLVVTPTPGTQGNTIAVTQSNGNVQVRVNGQIDAIQPAQSSLSRIVVYGSKASDNVSIAQDVTVPTTLNGGTGGTNRLVAGGGAARIQGWYGRFNTLQGGPQDDALFGRQGRVRFLKSQGQDILFAGTPGQPTSLSGIRWPNNTGAHAVYRGKRGTPLTGTYYRFVNNRLVPTHAPRFPVGHQRVAVPDTPSSGTSSDTGGGSTGGTVGGSNGG